MKGLERRLSKWAGLAWWGEQLSFLLVVAPVSQDTLMEHMLRAEDVGDLIVCWERPPGTVMMLLTLQTKYKAT